MLKYEGSMLNAVVRRSAATPPPPQKKNALQMCVNHVYFYGHTYTYTHTRPQPFLIIDDLIKGDRQNLKPPPCIILPWQETRKEFLPRV